MFNPAELIDRLREISPTICDYLDREQYRGSYENVYEFDVSMQVNMVLPILIKELQQLGISFSLPQEDIVSDVNYVDAICALREFFDKDNFYQIVFNKPILVKKIRTLFQSQDIRVAQYASHILDLCAESKSGDQLQIKRAEVIQDYLETDTNFTAHISAILDLCIPKSYMSEERLMLTMQFVNNVLMKQLYPLHQRCCRKLKETKVPVDFIPDSTEYVQFWYDLDMIEQFAWLSNLRKDDLDSSTQRGLLNWNVLAKIHWQSDKLNPSMLVHYEQREGSQESLLKCIVHQAIVNFVGKKPSSYPSLQYLLSNPKLSDVTRGQWESFSEDQREQINYLLYTVLVDLD